VKVMTCAQQSNAFEMARIAVGHVGKRTFADWMSIGIAIMQADFESKKDDGMIDYDRARRRLAAEKIVPPVGPIDVSHLRRIMKFYDEVCSWFDGLPIDAQIAWAAPSTILKYCPVFATKKPPRKTPLDAALKVIREALEEMDEPQRRSFGNSIFDQFRLIVTHPHDPERSSIDQLADDLADRLNTAHANTRKRVLPRFIKMTGHVKKAKRSTNTSSMTRFYTYKND
jgi:hypothetical protein